ncbi:GAF domain-containing protein (fragment) [Hyella patelloides LEGE 07179]|uniref:GAF domain-containing protein n=1 Tax=Hyella patelloides LEGE 07179 TaxID=945734 RepID=A0A563W4N5_9CYAN
MNKAFDRKLTLYRNLKKNLKVAVETTRKTLKCDRVIIYNANTLPQARVLAESVDPKYSSILGQTIKDPFLENDYLEESYGYGLSVTIDDIYLSDKSRSDLKDLEELEIKSFAIAPIFVENKLLAFLVAHQCSKNQPWDLKAVSFLAEKARIAGLTLSKIIKAEKSQNFNSAQQIVEIQKKQNSPTMEKQENNQGNEKLSHKQQPALTENKINRLFTDIKNKIAQKLEQKDILNTTVAEMSRLLKCDRVIVYSLDGANYGVVVAESVAVGWTEVLGKTRDELCFVARYLEEYHNGRVHAWDNTYEEDTLSCCLEELEALEVKAGIVAPIANNGQLLGLLIAHHCSDTRSWQQTEINWITEIANHVGAMLEYTKISDDNHQEEQQQLADTQRQIEEQMIWTKYFTDVIQQIRQSLHTEDILKTSVREVQAILNCDRVLIYSLDRDRYGQIVAESVSPGWTKAEGKLIKDPCFEAKYLEKYCDGRFRAWNNIYESEISNCYLEQLEKLEVKANLVTPIINEGKLFGLLVAQQCSNPRQWQQVEIRWLAQIATQVGFTLDNAQLLADAQRLRQQAEEERMWTEYFTDAVQQIRQSFKTKDVLQSSVREVRRVLNCDRVVVYSLNQDNYGIIAAESVAPGWTKAEGKLIKDPCFEAN